MAQVVIVGAGPAGTRATERVVAAGLRPIIVDEGRASGGQIYRRQPGNFRRPGRELYGSEAPKAEALHATFDGLLDRIDYRPRTTAWGIHDGAVHIVRDGRAEALPFDHLVLATGATDRLLPMAGWTLPGVYSLGGAQIALKSQGCAIGRRVALVGTGPLLYLVAHQYAAAGATIAGVFETASRLRQAQVLRGALADPRSLARGLSYRAGLLRRGVRVTSGIVPLAVEGEGAVGSFRYRDEAGRQHRVDCDAVAIGFGLRSETQLAELAGVPLAFDGASRQWLPEADAWGRTAVPGVYLAGDGRGIAGADVAELRGRLAAAALLQAMGRPVDLGEAAGWERQLGRAARFRAALDAAFPYPHWLAADVPGDTILCRCEAVSVQQLREAATAQGASELNRAKALRRVGMGRCQGRFCGSAAAEILSATLGADIAAVGRLRPQAPIKPLHVTDVPG